MSTSFMLTGERSKPFTQATDPARRPAKVRAVNFCRMKASTAPQCLASSNVSNGTQRKNAIFNAARIAPADWAA
jgi:hypothetical protein